VLGSNDRRLAATPANGIFRSAESKTLQISPSFIREYVAIGRVCLQLSIAKRAKSRNNVVISNGYLCQRIASSEPGIRGGAAVNLAAFASASAPLAAAVRGVRKSE
jgi:hypothetical protein